MEAALESKRANDLAEANSRSSDSLSRIEIDFRNKSLGAQIESLNDAKKQAEMEKEPYLQIKSFRFKDFQIDKPLNIEYELENLGSHPAVLIKRRIGMLITPVLPDKPLDSLNLNWRLKEESMNVYIKNVPKIFHLYTDPLLRHDTYDLLVSQKTFLYLYGKIIYKTISNKNREYSFCIYIEINPSNPQNSTGATILKSENRSLDFK